MKYINAKELFNQALAEEVDVGIYKEDGSYDGIYTAVLTSDLLKIANEMPSADVVEVVRCKDCGYSVCIHNTGEDWFCNIKYNKWGEPWATSPECFCDC